jgi:hypothetical protein
MAWEDNQFNDLEWVEVSWKNSLIFGKKKSGEFFIHRANGENYASEVYMKLLTEGFTPAEKESLGFETVKFDVPQA